MTKHHGHQSVRKSAVRLFDTTLRDGEQSAGVHLTPPQKAIFAGQLEAAGVDVIDAGFPYASEVDWKGVQAVAEATESVTLSAVATHLKKDIDQVRLALAGHESRSRLATRIGPYELYRKHADNPNIRSKLISGSRTAVSYAKDYFPEVQYYLNYAGMRDPKFMTELSQEVADAGATHVIVADSQSTFTPSQISDFTQQLVTAVGHQAKIGVHCHNMYGMAVANSVAAVEAGAVQVEATVGGIGDAGGNTALEQIAMYAEVFGKNVAPWDHSFQIKAIYSLAQELTRLTGFTFASNHPLVGPDTFKIEAGIHQTQILQVNPGLAPEWIGRTAEIVLGRHSGIQGIRLKAEELGIQTKDINWHHVYRLLMDKAASQGMLEDRDLHDAIDQSQHE